MFITNNYGGKLIFILAFARIFLMLYDWIPAFAGMTATRHFLYY